MRGLSDAYGSWNTIWTRRARCSGVLPAAIGRPCQRMLPASGRSSPLRQRASVLLPQPDSPTMPSVSPGASSSETSRSACRKRRGRRVSSALAPPATSKRLPRPCALSSGGAGGAAEIAGRRGDDRAHPSSPARRQALRWPASTSIGGGTTSRQAAIAKAQRGWKRQPAGGAARLGGSPSIGRSGSPRRCAPAAPRAARACRDARAG